MQRISFLGRELDSVNLTARLSEERAQSMLRCLESVRRTATDSPTSTASWTPRSPRPAYSAKRWRTLPNSSPPHRSRRRHFVTSCPGGPLLSPPHRRLQPLRLLVAEGALLRPPPPLQLGHNSSLHNGRSMELAAGKRRGPPPPLPSL